MNISDRDRKVLLIIIPIALIVGYWFLLLAPKREEAATAAKEVATQQERLTAAQGRVSQASAAKRDFASDYTHVVRLGKAVPSVVDMPGLLVQLDRASAGTGIQFTKITVGERATSAPTANPAPPAPSDGSQPPAESGGQPAQSAPGSAAESANNAAATSDQRNQAGEGGAAPAAGAPADGAPAGAEGAAAPPPGLDTVSLELEFQGNFFNLADFFHRVKRLVRVNNQNVAVSGRLITIEGVSYTSDPEKFPKLTAQLKATVYLVPASQGTSAGATPQGPSATTPAAGAEPAPAAPPSATATP